MLGSVILKSLTLFQHYKLLLLFNVNVLPACCCLTLKTPKSARTSQASLNRTETRAGLLEFDFVDEILI